jgi:6-pyruvoyl-tetrahydropterin synthase
MRTGYHRAGQTPHPVAIAPDVSSSAIAATSPDPKDPLMYAVEVSDHIMIAHSFRGEVFGPAQRLHGATFVVSAAFMADTLDANGIVVDIGRACEVLRQVLAPLNYRNLDDIPAFKSVNTTTEFLTRHVFDAVAAAARNGELGRAGHEIGAIRVTVAESPTARAWFEGALWQR